jgi:hypothetical protein
MRKVIKDIYAQSKTTVVARFIQIRTGHAYVSITDIMKIKNAEKKGKHLNTLENYSMCKMSKNGLHMNDVYIDVYN